MYCRCRCSTPVAGDIITTHDNTHNAFGLITPQPRDKYTRQIGPIDPTPEQVEAGTEPAPNMAILCSWRTPDALPSQPPLKLYSLTLPLSTTSNDTAVARSFTIELYNSRSGRPVGTPLGSATFPVPSSTEPTYRTFVPLGVASNTSGGSSGPGWPALNASTTYGILLSCESCTSPAQTLFWHPTNSLILSVETRNGFGTGLCNGRPDPSKPDQWQDGGYSGFFMQAMYGPA